MDSFDLLIVGAGPSGLAAAVEAKRGGLEKVVVLEKGSSHNQMIRTYYKEGKRVDARYAGQQAICFGLLCLRDGNRESYLALMDHVIKENKIDVLYGVEVWSVIKKDDVFEVQVRGGEIYKARNVLIAIGKMGRPKQPDYFKDIPVELKNSHRILFEITSREISDKKLLVVGGGDSAAEYCDILSYNNQVTLSYRGSEFSKVNSLNRSILEEKIANRAVRALMPSQISKIEAQEGRPIVFFKEEDHPPEVFDHVIYALGGMSPLEFLKNSKVKVNERAEPLVGEFNESSVDGLFIVGDLLGKGKGGGSIIAGFNSATAAIRSCLRKYFGKQLEAEVVTLDHLNF